MTSVAERKRAKKAARRVEPAKPRHIVGDREPKIAKADPPPKDRDGLLWLIKKRRLTPEQQRTAMTWRNAVRDATGVSIKSCIDVTAGGGGASWDRLQAAYVASTAAQMWLDEQRRTVLRGQVDMLTVLDGVCGAGQTLRELAGGDDRRAQVLEGILNVALDLVGEPSRQILDA